MEGYEKFCEKHRARIQGEPAQSATSLSAQQDNIPCIRFNGVPVLSPLLTLEKKKELQQDRKKALDLEVWRQNSRKRILLHHVQEILENVQAAEENQKGKKVMFPSPKKKDEVLVGVVGFVRNVVQYFHSNSPHKDYNSHKRLDLSSSLEKLKKSPNQRDLDQSETENISLALDSINGFVTQSNGVLPSSAAADGLMEPPKALKVKPVDMQVASIKNSLQENGQFVSPKQKDTCPSLSGNGDNLLSGSVNTLPSNETAEQESLEMVSAAEGGLDPYVMSLQNLLKKSREYIQREQTRRSMRVNSKRSVSESHSDKENDAVKMVKERGKLTGRSSIAVTLEKPALTRSSTSLQGASLSKNSTSLTASPSFSKVDIPMRSGTPPILDSDSDEDFKNASLFDRDSSILRSLTGSYSKLPSPEPSMSPKMHRRRPRPSSMGHIVINNPVNAYELSPKDKERAVGGLTRDIGDKRTASDPVPRLTSDFAPVCSHKDHTFHKSSSDISDELVVRKLSHGYQVSSGQRETKGFPASAVAEGELMSDDPRLPNSCLVNPTPQELRSSGYPLVTQNIASVSTAKQVGLDKAKPTELNKSYDVESPSPLLLQIQHSPLMDTPSVSLGNEQTLENGFEKVKRRLELGTESLQKESVPGAVAEGTGEPENHSWLRDQRGSVGSVLAAKHETPDRGTHEEETLKQKMLALEELRKRLEAQHVHQLSLLIAEQEIEQERLQKEIEMQERRLKGEEAAAAKTDIPQTALNSGMELGWRKISDNRMLESVLTQVGTIHSARLESAGFANATGPCLTADAPFYLWEPPASGKSVLTSRSLSRGKMRWSQVYSPEMKRKLDKISALAKGFLTRRLLQTEKLKHLSQTVKDTMEFIKNFQSEAPLKRGAVSTQDANLQERVVAQLRAALYDIHDIFFKMEVTERMNILRHDREVRKEKILRQLDKAKTLRERMTLSTATQKSLDRKKYMKAAEMGMPNKKTIVKQKTPENRVLQPNQGQNAPIQRLLSRQGTPKTSVKGAEQNRKKPSESRVPSKALSGAYAGRIQKKKPSVATT